MEPSKLKPVLLKEFSSKGIDCPVDEFILDDLVFNIEASIQFKQLINKDGVLVNINKDRRRRPILKPNPLLDSYDQRTKAVQTICKSLGLSKEGYKIALDIINNESEPKMKLEILRAEKDDTNICNYDWCSDYIQEAWDSVDLYVKGVKDGSITTNDYIKILVSWYEHILQGTDKYEFRREKVDRYFAFASLVNIGTEEGYKQIKFLPWQAFVRAILFGTYHKETDRRRFTEAFIYMGRKNAKTGGAVVDNLFMLLADNQTNPQAVLMSTVEARKRSIDEMKSIIMNSPELYPFVQISNYQIYLNNRKNTEDNGETKLKTVNDVGWIRIIPNDFKKLDSLKISGAIIDEIHTYPNNLSYLTLKKGTGTRENSLLIIITTAGYFPGGFCDEFVRKCKDILTGKVESDSVLPVLYCLDEEENRQYADGKLDISDKKLWHKVNPSLGTLLKMHQMEKWYNDALVDQSERYDFLTKSLNMFVTNELEEIIPNEHKVRALHNISREEFEKELKDQEYKDCYVGIDLSQKHDLSAVVCAFPDKERKKWKVLSYFFIPDDSKKFNRKNKFKLDRLIKDGWITKFEDSTSIDYTKIADRLKWISENFNVLGIGYDEKMWLNLEQYIRELSLGVRKRIPQGWSMSPSLVFIIKLFADQQIVFNNPTMLWNWQNAIIKPIDSNGNLKIHKDVSRDAVDGAVALNDAMAAYFLIELNPNQKYI